MSDTIESWKNHCPFCNADLPTSTEDSLCAKCNRPVKRFEIDGMFCWVPKRLGSFELEKFVGHGGMGIVFKGRSDEGDPVAIKIALGNFTRQLDNESEILRRAARLKVPFIASFRGMGAEQAGPHHSRIKALRWVATRWIGSQNLADIIEDKHIETADRLRILENIARGIRSLHENGIIHGDICPENIMLTDENEPYLGDFGVSRSLSLEDKTILAPLSTGGKAKYGAPEIWSGKEPGVKSDVYSFGKIALEFLTREKDFSQAKFSDVRPSLDKKLRSILERCCDDNIDHRPSDMEDICEAFAPRKTPLPFPVLILCLLSFLIGLLFGYGIPRKFEKQTDDTATLHRTDEPQTAISDYETKFDPLAFGFEPPPGSAPDYVFKGMEQPVWMKYTKVKKNGHWARLAHGDRFSHFSQWKIDGTVDQFVDRDLRQFIDAVKNHLVQLELSECNDLTALGFAKLVDARLLTDLTIRDCERFDNRAVQSLFSTGLPTVETKNMADSPLHEIAGNLFENVSLSPIKRLDLIDCPITDRSLEYLPTGLERLRIDGCREVTDEGLRIVADRFGKLQHLSIKNTGVTFAGVPQLFGLAWSNQIWTAGITANIVRQTDPPLPRLRKLEVDGCRMKGVRGDFGEKLKKGLKNHYVNNVEITGLAR